MINILKDIAEKLDGYFSDNQGYAVMSFYIEENGIRLSVKPYLKNEESSGKEECEHLMEMCSRLLDKYQEQGRHFTVLEAKMEGNTWELLIEELQDEQEEE